MKVVGMCNNLNIISSARPKFKCNCLTFDFYLKLGLTVFFSNARLIDDGS